LKTNKKTLEEIKKIYSEIKIAVVCREVNPTDGTIDVRLCELTTLDKVLIFPLQTRQKYNWNLKYYFIKDEYYNNETTREYLFDLIKNEKKSDMIINVEEI
jgi:hypothetical protein